MNLKVGDVVTNRDGTEFRIIEINESRIYSIITIRLYNGEEYTFTKEGYYQDKVSDSDMNLVLDAVELPTCDSDMNLLVGEEPTSCDECLPVEEPTSCECLPVDDTTQNSSSEPCETDRELAIKDVVDSITKYQVKLTKLLRVSLEESKSFDEVVYLTTLIKDSVELKETIKNI